MQLAVNYHPENKKWSIGTFISRTCGKVDSQDPYVRLFSLECRIEHAYDIQWQLNQTEWITFGIGRLREFGISPYENVVTGFGMAFSKFRQDSFLSRPSIGFYFQSGKAFVLFSSTFNEKMM